MSATREVFTDWQPQLVNNHIPLAAYYREYHPAHHLRRQVKSQSDPLHSSSLRGQRGQAQAEWAVSAQVRSRLLTGMTGLKSVAELSSNVDKMSAELRELESKLKHLNQNSAAILKSGELRERRRNITAQQEQLQQQIKNLETDIQQMETQLSEKKREEENQKKAVEKAQQGRSLSTLAATYREAAEEIQKRAAIQLRSKIAEHVGDLWVDITGRRREFLGMDFDKNWNCSLIRKDGSKIPWDETNPSAGQKQVRMLAFYEALSDVVCSS